ncbi:MAG: TldD/PmbA family protein [Thermoplasmata archaeon]
MTEIAEVAQRAADALRPSGTWEIFGERLRRYELYFDLGRTETIRGPIALEGVGLRTFRPADDGLAIGFSASNDLSAEGLRQAKERAIALAERTRFAARSLTLPTGAPRRPEGPSVCSVPLWDDPAGSLARYAHAIASAFDGVTDAQASFGSVKATLVETSVANSAGLSTAYRATDVEIEVAVKAFGGPEGRPPGEYWVTEEMRELDPAEAARAAATWIQRARDVRRANPPPAGLSTVALPPSLLAEILPQSLGLRFGGAGRLQGIGLEAGTAVADGRVSLHDDRTIDRSPGSAPVDDEGCPTGRIPLIEQGRVGELLYDALHASAFGLRPNGAATRAGGRGGSWYRFADRPRPGIGTLVLAPGPDGTGEEALHGVEEGLWVDQLGWPRPDPLSGAFGGELRIGYRIHRGRLAEPLRGGTVGGLVFAAEPGTPSLLGSVRALGSRPERAGALVSPLLVTDGLTVGGGS